MLATVVVCVFIGAASAAPDAAFIDALGVNQHLKGWEDFKTTFKKSYESAEEEINRFKIFVTHSMRVEQHNSEEAQDGRHGFETGINEYADLTSEEFVKQMNGFRRKAEKTSQGPTFLEPANVVLPDHVDWRTKGYVTPVKNQGQCGSCWAFSAVGSLEGQHFKKTGKLVSLSEQNLVDCSGKYGNEGCSGGLMDQAFSYIKDNHGIDTEASYPYTAEDGTCKFKKNDIGATDTGFVDVASGNETALQFTVAAVGPVSVAIDASQWSFQMYKRGVYNEPDCSSEQLDHGVLAVGYGQQGKRRKRDYWIVKNSWGASWGQNGYILMSRNKHNQCGIATTASYPLV